MTEKVPFWIVKFSNKVRGLKRLSGDRWYKHPQSSLATLKRTGQGNCVAWSRLMAEIAVHVNLFAVLLVIGERYESRSKLSPHQICVVVDKDNVVWIQSNIWYVKYKKLRLPLTQCRLQKILRKIATRNGKVCGYKTGTVIHSTITMGKI